MTDDEQIIVICRRGRSRQAIPILAFRCRSRALRAWSGFGLLQRDEDRVWAPYGAITAEMRL